MSFKLNCFVFTCIGLMKLHLPNIDSSQLRVELEDGTEIDEDDILIEYSSSVLRLIPTISVDQEHTCQHCKIKNLDNAKRSERSFRGSRPGVQGPA